MNIYIYGWWFGSFFVFPYIGNVIVPSDEVIVFRGVGILPTSIYIVKPCQNLHVWKKLFNLQKASPNLPQQMGLSEIGYPISPIPMDADHLGIPNFKPK